VAPVHACARFWPALDSSARAAAATHALPPALRTRTERRSAPQHISQQEHQLTERAFTAHSQLLAPRLSPTQGSFPPISAAAPRVPTTHIPHTRSTHLPQSIGPPSRRMLGNSSPAGPSNGTGTPPRTAPAPVPVLTSTHLHPPTLRSCSLIGRRWRGQ